jgi:heptosyltransferase II
MKKYLVPEKINRLLIRGTNWVGDAVMSLPALHRIRRAFPETHISLLVLPWVSGVYEEAVFIDELILYDREGIHQGLKRKARLLKELRSRRFDAAILLQNAFEAAAVAFLSGIPARAGYDRDGRGWLLTCPVAVNPAIKKFHQVFYYLDLIGGVLGESPLVLPPTLSCPAPLIPPEFMPDMTLQVSAVRQEMARRLLDERGVDLSRPLVGVNPGAFYGSAKRWPEDRFAALLDKLIQQTGWQVVLFGSPREKIMAEKIQEQMKCRVYILSGQTSLAALIALMSCCHLFITNDSGPMHLAAALRIPTVAIFGSTDDIATGPLSPKAVVINKRVECSPCLLRECPIDLRCMTRISMEEVLELSLQMLRPGDRQTGIK